MTQPKKKALGRGLDALISTDGLVRTQGSSSICEIPTDRIHANPDQPRREFDPESLAELAESVKELGIIQPITLRKVNEDDYQIIAGERRFRASLLAGLKTIPAYVRTADDESVMEMALIENVQREDLNSMEIALACQNLIEMYGMTQEQLAARIGKKRATVANYVRLLKLPAEIQMALKNRTIEMGHARALLAIEDTGKQLQLFHELVRNGYSVRMVEMKARLFNEGRHTADDGHIPPVDLKPFQDKLSEYLGTNVRMKNDSKGKGSISIPFKNENELHRLMQLFALIRK